MGSLNELHFCKINSLFFEYSLLISSEICWFDQYETILKDKKIFYPWIIYLSSYQTYLVGDNNPSWKAQSLQLKICYTLNSLQPYWTLNIWKSRYKILITMIPGIKRLLRDYLFSPKLFRVEKLIMIIELSGVQFGL